MAQFDPYEIVSSEPLPGAAPLPTATKKRESQDPYEIIRSDPWPTAAAAPTRKAGRLPDDEWDSSTPPRSESRRRSETTYLDSTQEAQFQSWAKKNKIRDVDHPLSFYDYRGYWKDIASKGQDQRQRYADGLHFPDTYKQHGHPTFSIESKYSSGPTDGGRWEKGKYIAPKPQAGPVDMFLQGIDSMQGMMYRGVEALGEAAGADSLAQWAGSGARANEKAVKDASDRYSRTQFTDIRGPGSALTWAMQTGGEMLPNMAPSMAGGYAGAALGGSIGTAIPVPLLGTLSGATIGGFLGALFPSLLLGVGETQGAIKERGGEDYKAPGYAIAGGSLIGALDAITPGDVGTMLERRFGKEAAEAIIKRTLAKPVTESMIRRVSKEGVKGILEEGLTEGAQEVIGEVATAYGTNTPIDPELGHRVIESSAAGALMGGASEGLTAAIPERGHADAEKRRVALVNTLDRAIDLSDQGPEAATMVLKQLEQIGFTPESAQQMMSARRAMRAEGAAFEGTPLTEEEKRDHQLVALVDAVIATEGQPEEAQAAARARLQQVAGIEDPRIVDFLVDMRKKGPEQAPAAGAEGATPSATPIEFTDQMKADLIASGVAETDILRMGPEQASAMWQALQAQQQGQGAPGETTTAPPAAGAAAQPDVNAERERLLDAFMQNSKPGENGRRIYGVRGIEIREQLRKLGMTVQQINEAVAAREQPQAAVTTEPPAAPPTTPVPAQRPAPRPEDIQVITWPPGQDEDEGPVVDPTEAIDQLAERLIVAVQTNDQAEFEAIAQEAAQHRVSFDDVKDVAAQKIAERNPEPTADATTATTDSATDTQAAEGQPPTEPQVAAAEPTTDTATEPTTAEPKPQKRLEDMTPEELEAAFADIDREVEGEDGQTVPSESEPAAEPEKIAGIPEQFQAMFRELLAGAKALGYDGTTEDLVEAFKRRLAEARVAAREMAPDKEDSATTLDLLKVISKGGGIAIKEETAHKAELEELLWDMNPKRKRTAVVKKGKRAGRINTLPPPQSGGVPGVPGIIVQTGNFGKTGQSLDNMLEHVRQDPRWEHAFPGEIADFLEAVNHAIKVELGVHARPQESSLGLEGILRQIGVTPDRPWWNFNETPVMVAPRMGGTVHEAREKETISEVEERSDEILDAYEEQNGTHFNADQMSELLGVHEGDERWKHLIAVRSSAGALTIEGFRRALRREVTPANENVQLLGGGTGSGKSTWAKVFPEGLIVLDTTLGNLDASIANVEEAIRTGHTVDITYVYRDPIEAFLNGVVRRLRDPEDGRPVSLYTHANTHFAGPRVLNEIAKAYNLSGDETDFGPVQITIVENMPDGSMENRDLAWLREKAGQYNDVDALRSALDAAVSEAVRAGTLTPAEARSLGATEAVASGEPREGRQSTEGRGGEGAEGRRGEGGEGSEPVPGEDREADEVGESKDTRRFKRPDRENYDFAKNHIGSFALEDALSPEAKAALDAIWKKPTRAKDKLNLRQAMEIYHHLTVDVPEPDAEAFGNFAPQLLAAVNRFLTDQTRDNALNVQAMMWEGLKLITGKDDETADWADLAENNVFADAREAGDLIWDTLDPKTASFDIETFSNAYGDIEFRKDQDEVFPPHPEQINLQVVVPERVSQEKGAEIVQSWKDEAKRIGETEDHSNHVIVSLFDVTGIMSKPWRDAGYTVLQYDIRSGDDLTKLSGWMGQVEDLISQGHQIVGIIGQPPCTSFSVAGNKWWETHHNTENRQAVIDAYGLWVPEYFEKPIDYARALVAVVKLAVAQSNPVFYAMENPIGRINAENNLPDAALTFDPHHFGDAYTKRTGIWGEFNTDLPTANVEPILGSLVHEQRGYIEDEKDARSVTPEGFAYAFFMANKDAWKEAPAGAAGMEALDREARAAGFTPETPGGPIPDTVTVFRSGDVSKVEDMRGHINANVPVGIVAGRTDPAVRKAVVEYVENGGKLFIDSGAFQELKSGKAPNFSAVLDFYNAIAAETAAANQIWVVAPDKVGDATATRERQKQHADEIDALIESGVNVIVPLQVFDDGKPRPVADIIADAKAIVTRFPEAQIGLPGNKAAISDEDFEAILEALPSLHGVHFLGIGERNARFPSLVRKVGEYFEDAVITADSNRTRALMVPGRPAHTEAEREARRRAEHEIDDVGESDTTELVGLLYAGDLDVFTPEELEAIAATAGISVEDLRNAVTSDDVAAAFSDLGVDERLIDGAIHDIARQRGIERNRPGARRDTITKAEGGEGVFTKAERAAFIDKMIAEGKRQGWSDAKAEQLRKLYELNSDDELQQEWQEIQARGKAPEKKSAKATLRDALPGLGYTADTDFTDVWNALLKRTRAITKAKVTFPQLEAVVDAWIAFRQGRRAAPWVNGKARDIGSNAELNALIKQAVEKVKAETPVEPKKEVLYNEQGRPLREDGRLEPLEGDKVYQIVRGFGGTPAYIHGEVFKAKGGALRVRTTKIAAMIGGGGQVGKTYPVDLNWTVENDPEIERRKQAREDAEQARQKQFEEEKAEAQRETDALRRQLIAKGGRPVTNDTRIGARVRVVRPGEAEYGTVVEKDEDGSPLVLYDADIRDGMMSPRTLGKAEADGTYESVMEVVGAPDAPPPPIWEMNEYTLASAMNIPVEQAQAALAVLSSFDIDPDRLRAIKGGTPGDDALRQDDLLSTGERQPRLPGAENVRDQEVEQPALGELFFGLEGGADERTAVQETLFGAPHKPEKKKPAKPVQAKPGQDSLFQTDDVAWKAAVEFTKAGLALVRGMSSPDVSSALHEFAHVARRFVLNRSVPEEHRAGITDEDIRTAEMWAGVKDGVWTEAAEEKFARGFERYMRNGIAPTASLKNLFAKIANWLGQIYATIEGSDIDIDISPEMQRIYDKLMTRREARERAEAAATGLKVSAITSRGARANQFEAGERIVLKVDGRITYGVVDVRPTEGDQLRVRMEGAPDHVLLVDARNVDRYDEWLLTRTIPPAPAAEKGATATAPSAAKATITVNDRGNIEVKFPGKPAPEVLKGLKENGMRWNPKDKVWYGKNTTAKRASLQRLLDVDMNAEAETEAPTTTTRGNEPPIGTAWMNEGEIDRAVERFKNDPVLGPAARFLEAFKDEVNRTSDGWPYWKPAAQAAGKLMGLLEAHLNAGMGAYPERSAPTAADVQATLAPIKSFMTRRGNDAGIKLPALELPTTTAPKASPTSAKTSATPPVVPPTPPAAPEVQPTPEIGQKTPEQEAIARAKAKAADFLTQIKAELQKPPDVLRQAAPGAPKPAAPVNPKVGVLMLKVVQAYLTEGIRDFRVVALGVREALGPEADRVSRHLEVAWKRFVGEDKSVADVLASEPTITSEAPDGGVESGAGRSADSGGGAAGGRGSGSPEVLEGVSSEDGGQPEAERPGRPGEPDQAGVVREGAGDRSSTGTNPGASPLPGGRAVSGDVVSPSGAVSPAGIAQPAYEFTPERLDAIASRGDVTRLEDNIAIIRLVQTLARERRHATAEEQELLAKWVGWGATNMAMFLEEEPRENWSRNQKRLWQELRDLTTPAERRALEGSTVNAHYTYQLYAPIWAALRKAGFTGGRVLEPAVGSGHAFGVMPTQMRANSILNGVELEPYTAAVAQHLYPEAKIQPTGYENARLSKNGQDLVISNVPFGNYKAIDESLPDEVKQSIHNYFFAKALEHVRPGGLIVFVTSRHTLDGPEFMMGRRYLAERAHFLGAIRLPSSAFSDTAKTKVVADLIVMKKLEEGEVAQNRELFILSPKSEEFSRETTTRKGDVVQANVYRSKWWDANPDLILGAESLEGRSIKENEYTVTAPAEGLEARLAEALAKILPPGTYVPRSEALTETTAPEVEKYEPVKPGDIRVRDGKAYTVGRDGTETDVTPMTNVKDKKTGKVTTRVNTAGVERIEGMIGVRDALRETLRVMSHEASTNEQVKRAQFTLNKVYDAFRKKYGVLNTPYHRRLFLHDPDVNALMGLEVVKVKSTMSVNPKTGKKTLRVKVEVEEGKDEHGHDKGKAEIFYKRTIKAPTRVTHVETPYDGLLTSLGVKNTIDWPYIARLTGDGSVTRDRVAALQEHLSAEGHVFQQPDGTWVTKDAYLSGDVVTKLDDAKAADADHPGVFTRNVAALEAVQPTPKAIDDIDIRLGAHWVPHEYLKRFIADELGGDASKVPVTVDSASTYVRWTVDAPLGIGSANIQHPLAVKYGPDPEHNPLYYTFIDLVRDAINLNQPTLTYKQRVGPDEITVKDQAGTLAARAKLEMLQKSWTRWVYEHEDAKDAIVKLFNTRYNRNVKRDFNGAHMQEVLNNNGLSLPHTLHSHQLRAVYRANVTGNTLLAHDVGAGKTYEMIAIAMEMRRLGRANKPMITVPTYLLGSWKRDMLRAYPKAKILAFEEKDLSADKRQQAMARIAYGDWDMVLVPHSSFQLLKVSEDRTISMLEELKAELEAAETQAKARDGRMETNVKKIAMMRKKIEAKIDKLMKSQKEKKEKGLTWEQLGVDALLVDEAHYFKNLFFFSKIENIRGLSRSEADKALDMYIKVRDINDASGERNIIFATATPVMNSMAELYSMQRYLQPRRLREQGLENFDNWYQMFAKALPSVEKRPDGSYQEVMRLKDFQNLQTLYTTMSDVLDYVGWDDMKHYLKLPEIAGGKIDVVQTEQHPIYPKLKEWFTLRMANVRAMPPHVDNQGTYIAPPRPDPITGEPMRDAEGNLVLDNILTIMTDAKKAAIDPRLILGGSIGDFPGSRVQLAAKRVGEYYKQTADNKGAALIFLDYGTPKDPEPLEFLQGVEIDDETEGASLGVEDEGDEDEVTPQDDSAFNLYNELKKALMAQGIPSREIAFIHQAKNPAQRLALFDAVKDGTVRVLVGSTDKGGVGMNVQDRLGLQIDLDVPMKQRPGDVRQRLGRSIRQGNKFIDWGGVQVVRYVTKGTTDEWLYGLIGNKYRLITQFMRGEATGFTDIDPELLTIEEAEILSSDDPRGIELLNLRAALPRLEALAISEDRDIGNARQQIADGKRTAAEFRKIVAESKPFFDDHYTDLSGDKFVMHVEGKEYTKRVDAFEALREVMAGVAKEQAHLNMFEAQQAKPIIIGTYGGLTLHARRSYDFQHKVWTVTVAMDVSPAGGFNEYGWQQSVTTIGVYPEPKAGERYADGTNPIQVIENRYRGLANNMATFEERITQADKQVERAQALLKREPVEGPKYEEAKRRIAELEQLFVKEAEEKDKAAKAAAEERQRQAAAQAQAQASKGSGPGTGSTSGYVNPPGSEASATPPIKKTSTSTATTEASVAPAEGQEQAPPPRPPTVGPAPIPASARTEGGPSVAKAIQVPELVELVTDATGEPPQVVAKFRAMGWLGAFRHVDKDSDGMAPWGRVLLRADLFKKGNEAELAAVLAHEIGHLIDWLPSHTLKRGNLLGRLQSLHKFLKHTFTNAEGDEIKLKEVKAELIKLSALWRAWDREKAPANYRRYRDSSRELYADALSVILNDPGLAMKEAPIFYEQFMTNLDQKPDVRAKLFELYELLDGTPAELIERRLKGLMESFQRGDERAIDAIRRAQAEANRGGQSVWSMLKHQVLDKHMYAYEAEAKAAREGRPINPDDKLSLALEERTQLGGEWKAFVEENVQPIKHMLDTAGVDWHTFGAVLFAERIISGDRSEMGAPRGLQPEYAQELLDKINADVLDTPEKKKAMAEAVKRFRKMVADMRDEAYAAGLYTDETYKDMVENAAYAAFRVIDYIDKEMSWRVYHQIGTLKDIQNPADATLLKMFSTFRMVRRQRMLRKAWSLLHAEMPGSIEQAEERGQGKHRQILPPKDKSKTLVYYWEHGKLQGKYVDAYIGDSLNNNSIGHNLAVVKILRAMNQNWFRPVFTSRNVGFQIANAKRDFFRTWKNMPKEREVGAAGGGRKTVKKSFTMREALQRYWQSRHLARVRAFGLPENPTQAQIDAYIDKIEAEKAGILGLTLNEVGKNRQIMDTQIEDILAMSNVGQFEEKEKPLDLHPRLERLRGPLEAARQSVINKRLVRPILEFLEKAGDYIETLPKAAAMYEFKGEGSIADIPPETRSFIRTSIGTPDAAAGGSAKPIINELFLFSNIYMQGWRADLRIARDPKTRNELLWKTAAVNILPKMIMFALLYMMGGDDDDDANGTVLNPLNWMAKARRILAGASEYDKTNYTLVPLWYDEKGNSIYYRMPQDDTGRVVSGLVWKAMQAARGDVEMANTIATVFDYAAGQTPSLMPAVGTAGEVTQYMSGQRVYDPFRNRFLLTEQEADLGPLSAHNIGKFTGYEFQKLGGGVVWKFYVGEDRPRQNTWGQTILELPVNSNIVGRFVRATNFGQIERLRDVQGAVRRESSRASMSEKEAVNDALDDFMDLPKARQTESAARRAATKVAKDLNPGLRGKELESEVKDITKKLRTGAIRGEGDPLVDRVLSARSNAEKVALIVAASQGKSATEIRRWLRVALDNKVISVNVRRDAERAIRRARVHAVPEEEGELVGAE